MLNKFSGSHTYGILSYEKWESLKINKRSYKLEYDNINIVPFYTLYIVGMIKTLEYMIDLKQVPLSRT